MKIAIATTTRADWGLLSPLAAALRDSGADIRIMAAAMHFDPLMGETWREIEADGFALAARIPATGTPAQIAATCLQHFDKELDATRPDCIICLGDRYEMLAIATAASLRRIPIVHIAGGAVSEGAFDDAFRHAITKLASLHLTETEEYRRRVISMGEHPRHVINTGAIGVHNIMSLAPIGIDELESSIGMKLGRGSVLCTMHAATMSRMPAERQLEELLAALESFPELRILFTHPNNDTDPEPLINMLRDFADTHPSRAVVIPSLGRVRYLSALRHVDAVIGNSSGGIVEVPSMGIPTLDIGIRQRGRTAATSVLHCGETAPEIRKGLSAILTEEFRKKARETVNPYGGTGTLDKMVNAILGTDFSTILPKSFYQA